MKRKGFTLIELLAVIVILAIIALISVPLITGVIKKAQEGAAKAGAIGYIKAVETQVAKNAVDKTKGDITEGTFNVSQLSDKGVAVKGNGPEMGNVTIEKGEVTSCALIIGDYTVTCLGNGEYDVTPGNNLNSIIKLGDLVRNMLNDNTTYGNYTFMNGSYLKGVQNENYVSFGGHLWRIMGLNEDGTVRLITQEGIISLSYGPGGSTGYSKEDGYIHYWMNNDFLNNLNDTKNIIKESQWCLNSTDKDEIDYGTSNETARDNCEGGELFNAKVGLITLDEFNLSRSSNINSDSYLLNNDYFWTLTPLKSTETGAAWLVTSSYYSTEPGNVKFINNVRPVINISPDVVVEKTEGTEILPYIIK